jgi:hypothetical protein
MALLVEEKYESDLDPSRVVLKIWEEPDGTFFVTEDRQGTTTIVSMLGTYDTRDAALARLAERGRELEARRYDRVRPAA